MDSLDDPSEMTPEQRLAEIAYLLLRAQNPPEECYPWRRAVSPFRDGRYPVPFMASRMTSAATLTPIFSAISSTHLPAFFR